MSRHPEIQKLKQFAGIGKELSSIQKEEIVDHLQSCHLCKERVKVLEAYQKKIDEGLKQVGEAENLEYEKEKWHTPGSSTSLVKTYEAPLETYKEPPKGRLIRYFQVHPIRSFTVVATSALLGIVLFLTEPWVNKNPNYAKVENNVLTAFNENGEKLWDISADGIPEGVSSKDKWSTSPDSDRYIYIADIDGEGENEVLITGDNNSYGFTNDTVYCINHDGSIRWKQSPPELIEFGEADHTETGKWEIAEFFTVKHTDNKEPRLFVIAQAKLSFAGIIFEMHPKTGEVKQSYWHAGHFQSLLIIENNGEKEIILGATNNSLNQASIVVIDPDSIDGRAPMSQNYRPNDIKPGQQKQYITFSPSILSDLYNTTGYNSIFNIYEGSHGNLIVRTREVMSKLPEDQQVQVSIFYVLDKNYEVIKVYGDDPFLKFYSDLYKRGEIQEPLNDDYWEQVKESVRYWDGERFVSEPLRIN